MSVKVVELGCPGHFICASYFRWRRHSQVGDRYRVSSVGDYFPDRDGERQTIGAGDDAFFETLVFKTNVSNEDGNEGCGCRSIAEWGESDGTRYATAGEAQIGHDRYVAKYRKLANKESK